MFRLSILLISALFLVSAPIESQEGRSVSGDRENKTERSEDTRPRGRLGIGFKYEEDAGPPTRGLLRVVRILSDSPAEQSGLQVGDAIMTVNGHPFRFADDAEAARSLGWVRAGDMIEVDVVRDGKPLTLEIQAVAMSAEDLRRRERSIASGRKTRAMMWLNGIGTEGRILSFERVQGGSLVVLAPEVDQETLLGLGLLFQETQPFAGPLAGLRSGDRLKLRVRVEITGVNRSNVDFEYVETPAYMGK